MGFSEPEGSGALKVLMMGESLGGHEEEAGLPFRKYAPAGSVLERAIRGGGYTREQFGLWNVLGCRPPNNDLAGMPYEVEAINKCKVHRDRVIEAYQPRVILALGSIALRTLTGKAGYRQGITSLRGFALPAMDYQGIQVVGGIHPSALRQGKMNWLGLLVNDIHYAVEIAQGGLRPAVKRDYKTRPSEAQAQAFYEEARATGLPIAYDLETGYSAGEGEEDVMALEGGIIMVQFSLRAGEGIAFPYTGEFKRIAKAILALPNKKLGFNVYHFDNPKLLAEGFEINGEVEDLMWKAHHMQPELPRNLQSVASLYVPEFGPWKQKAQIDMGDYGCDDVSVLHFIDKPLTEAMIKKDVLRGYERHIRQLWPILESVAARGLPIDKVKQDEMRADLNELLVLTDAKLQALHPMELRNVQPKAGFVRPPKNTEGLVQREFKFKVALKDPCSCVDEWGVITGWGKKGTGTTKCPKCKGKGLVRSGKTREDVATRFARPLPFRPSQQQLVRYIRWRGHPVPRSIDDPSKDSTAKMQIDKLAKKTKDPLYLNVLDYRGIEKMKSAYVDAWVPSILDGRLHWHFKYTPATGQLAAVDPNVLTLPTERIKIGPKEKRIEIGKRFRQTIVAPPGYCLIAADFSAFHAKTLAFEAQDEAYMRIASMDPHSFLTARMLRLKEPEAMLAMPDDELRDFLGWVKANHKDTRDGKAKPVVLGYGFGLGANKMYEMNSQILDPETGEILQPGFINKRECQVLIDLLRSLFPKTRQYQIDVQRLAHRQGYLWNRHGYIRWFWDVLANDPKTGEAGQGDQAEAAIAFNPACDAHGHIKDVVILLEEHGFNERMGLVNIVHDELLFCCPLALREEALVVIPEYMERPSMVLTDPLVAPGGLTVGAELTVGWNRGEMMKPSKFAEHL